MLFIIQCALIFNMKGFVAVTQLNSLGNNIRKLRQAHGWSQTELAEKVGVTAAYIGMLERSEKEPKLSTLIRIANIFETGLDSLLSEKLISERRSIASDYFQSISKMPVESQKTIFSILDVLIHT